MKRIFALFLVLSMILLSSGSVLAEENMVLPFPAETEVNTSWGVYLADIPDASGLLNSGSVKVSLYAQDQYRLEDIEALHAGSSVQVGGAEYRVSQVTVRDDGSIAIDGGENTVPVVFRPLGEVYVATRNDSAVGRFVGDYTLMLPLPDAFRFYWMHSGENIAHYDGNGFADLLAGNDLPDPDRSCTVLSFSGGQPSAVVIADFTVAIPEETLHKAAASGVSPSNPSPSGPVLANGVGSFTMQPITWQGAGLGKCAVPAGYTLYSEVHCGDETTCLGAPIRVHAQVVSNSASSTLGYFSSEMYLERIKSGYFPHRDGQLDSQMYIFMMRYMDASQCCDWLASRLVSGSSFWKNEDSSFFNSKVEAALNEYRNEVEPGLKAQNHIKTNWFDVTAAHKVYTYEYGGVTYALCILAEVRAYQLNAAGEVMTAWDIPEYYYMSCPLSDYERIHATDFQAFIANTAISDTFKQLQEDLTKEIQRHIQSTWAAAIAASNAYVRAMNALTSQSVNSYLSSSSYSASDRFSDYIFDRNEYTTSDGYSCSISTSYDYVWEGSNGTVYYSNSAFDMPSGATQLSPR